MHKQKWMSVMIQITALLSFLILAAGFVLSIQDILSPPTTNALTKKEEIPPPIKKENGFIVGLGDSLTRGIGDEKGLGYIGIVRAQLQKKTPNSTIQFTNLAINGQTSSELVDQLKQHHVQHLIKQARWIPITIGGNDLRVSAKDIQKIDLKLAERNRIRFEKNLEQILATIRTHNPQAPVFLFSLYNPYGDLADKELTSSVVLEWNETLQAVGQKYPNVVIVPIFDLFQLQPSKYLSSDHLHPNHEGYQRMAMRLLQVIEDTSKGREQ